MPPRIIPRIMEEEEEEEEEEAEAEEEEQEEEEHEDEEDYEQDINLSILEGVDQAIRHHPYQLAIEQESDRRIDRASVQYLADFLQDSGDGGGRNVTELDLYRFYLPEQSDGGLNVLCDLFAHNNTTITKVSLSDCIFGSEQEVPELFAALETNRSVTDLTMNKICRLEDAVLGRCLSGLLQNNPTLQRLDCSGTYYSHDFFRALQPGLGANRYLKDLCLEFCNIDNEGIRLLTDALVGNTTMERLGLFGNPITSAGLVHITRLLESTHVKDTSFGNSEQDGIFDDHSITQHFAHVLSENKFLTTLGIPLVGAAAAMIFQAIERNNGLENLTMSSLNDNYEAPPQDNNSIHEQGVAQLFESLPRIKVLKKLELNDPAAFDFCLRNASLLPSLHKNTSLEELHCAHFCFPNVHITAAAGEVDLHPLLSHYRANVMEIRSMFSRNAHLKHANALLLVSPPPSIQTPRLPIIIAAKSGLWCKAFAKFATSFIVTNNDDDGDDANNNNNGGGGGGAYTGASAIFKILQARPAILQPLLRRPPAAAAAAISSSPRDDDDDACGPTNHHDQQVAPDTNGNGGGGNDTCAETPAASAQKRRRLS